MARKKWDREKILSKILEWNETCGRPPLSLEWDSTGGYWPSTMSVVRNFGSWNAAIEEAGFTPRRRTKL